MMTTNRLKLPNILRQLADTYDQFPELPMYSGALDVYNLFCMTPKELDAAEDAFGLMKEENQTETDWILYKAVSSPISLRIWAYMRNCFSQTTHDEIVPEHVEHKVEYQRILSRDPLKKGAPVDAAAAKVE